ncbi:hypothetical protein [Lactiplantibacillus herbarum]|uniref:hypothetical protein n=1 Tax=Lactiplantibacillus herbarum TaxID=1670446 RepID=UPI000ACD9CC0|nr:hypothetical protein [Lactiplantibacillus herbarum]
MMQKVRGIGIILLLSGLLMGCQKAADQGAKIVRPTTARLSAVNSVSTHDFWGRWVSSKPATSLYLSGNQQYSLFQADQPTLQGHSDLKLDNSHATLTIDKTQAQLTLTDANQMTLNYKGTQLTLTKDPNWEPKTDAIPEKATTALKATSLSPAFKISY